MEAGNGKSRDFGLSQAVANQVVRKGSNFQPTLCGLSPPVSRGRLLARIYTSVTIGSPTTILNSESARWSVTSLE